MAEAEFNFTRWRAAIIACAVIAAVAAVVSLWPSAPPGKTGGRQGGGEGRPVPVTTAPVARRDVPIYLDALGTVQAYNTVTIRSRVDGELLDVSFREGQDVMAGDVLARIDPRTYQAQHDQVLAARDRNAALLEAARRDLARYVSLGDRVTGQSVDTQRSLVRQLEAAVRSDEAAIANARTMLGYTVITSPLTGRTGMRLVDRGNIVRAGDATGLVSVAQIQPISVIFTLPQQTLPAIAEQMRQQGRLAVHAIQPETRALIEIGELEMIDNQIDQATGTIRLKAVMANGERKLWPGGFVNVRLLLTVRQGGLVIPAASVQRGPRGPYVFVVKADLTADMRGVKVVTVEGDQALVESGLDEGELVVAEGVAKLAQGSRIASGEGRDGKGKGRAAP